MILLAIFSVQSDRAGGAVVYIIAHGLFSAALFLMLGYIEEREETRALCAARRPRRATIRACRRVIIAALAALGLPGLAGFAGEILILTGVYRPGTVWAALIALVPIVARRGATCCVCSKPS